MRGEFDKVYELYFLICLYLMDCVIWMFFVLRVGYKYKKWIKGYVEFSGLGKFDLKFCFGKKKLLYFLFLFFIVILFFVKVLCRCIIFC